MARSNQCQVCGDFGHNRRGCPVVKASYEKVERVAQVYGIEPTEDERAYAATSWITRINEAAEAAGAPADKISYRERWHWEEIAERKLAQARKNARGRTCGFCGESGHNARTCKHKKQHKLDADAMQGLAHRVVAACMSKAGIVPGALMRLQEWDMNINDYGQVMCVVTGINWEQVANPGYDNDQGSPRHFDDWFKGPIIKVRKPCGREGYMRIPQNIKQQSHYRYYDKEPGSFGLMSGVVGAPVNKDSGWKGDITRPLSDRAHGVYHWGAKVPGDLGERLVDADLEPAINDLINEVSKWTEH